MKTIILIMVISGQTSSNSGKATINQEFDSLEQCNYVRAQIIKQVNLDSHERVIVHGCFEKGVKYAN